MDIRLAGLDWGIILVYCVASLVIGWYYSRRASKNTREFFVADAKLPWWIAGTSIVATTFAADTPLFVSGLVRKSGIHENWVWWNFLLGGMMCTFLFARMWRRAAVLTDNEFIELRYQGRQASVLRGFLALHGGLLRNAIVMGWVISAMCKIAGVLLGLTGGIATDSMPLLASAAGLVGLQLPPAIAAEYVVIPVLLIIAATYSVMSGYWGVVMTDMIQFVMAMGGSILLALFVLFKTGTPAELATMAQAAPEASPTLLHFAPDLASAGWLVVLTFVVNISVAWWSKGQGDGYIVQRLFSTRNERHSVLASLWFNFAHYVLRPWPWIIVGLASLIYIPRAACPDAEQAYPMMIGMFLPVGLRGLMVASLLAAFMSTMDTQMNWGASYLINDFYKRFMVRDKPESHYILASRLAMVLLAMVGAASGFAIGSIAGAWKFLIALTAGAGLVGMARWYWWRVNAWSELSAMIASFFLATGGFWIGLIGKVVPLQPDFARKVAWFYSGEAFGPNLLFIVAVCTVVWVAVTFLTEPGSPDKLDAFYRRVRPGGWWGPVATRCPDVTPDRLAPAVIGWVSGSICIFSGLMGVGYVCIGRYLLGAAWLAATGISGWVMMRQIGPSGATPGPSDARPTMGTPR